MYVRFVAAAPSQNAYRATGIFTILRWLRDDGKLDQQEIEFLNEIFEWYNTHLPAPPFREKLQKKAWTDDAVAWFRDDAKEYIEKMWDMVAVLKAHGEPVRFVQTNNPGKIVYSDEYQIVAETPRQAFNRRTKLKL